MPDSTLSQALKEAYAAAPSDVIIYHTLELNHPAFDQPIYVVNDYDDLLAYLETAAPVTFLRFAFRLTKPEVSPVGVPQVTVEIDNVSRDILANVQLAMTSTDLITMGTGYSRPPQWRNMSTGGSATPVPSCPAM